MKFGQRVSDRRGQVVITRFECPNLYALFMIRVLHVAVKQDVGKHAIGYLGSTTIVVWRERTLLSISLWDSLDSIYSMGHVGRHVMAARVPHRLGVQTSSAIYTHRGDWRSVLFDTAPHPRAEPIVPIGSAPTCPTDEQVRQPSSRR